MKDVNKIILVGRLGANPNLRMTKKGNAVAHFSVATTSLDDHTQWHQIVVWGKQAENCAQYLQKGQLVFVEGSLRSRSYESEEGNSKTIFEVIANEVSFLSYKVPLDQKSA